MFQVMVVQELDGKIAASEILIATNIASQYLRLADSSLERNK